MRLLTGQKVLLEGHQNLPTDENNAQSMRYEMKSTMKCHKNMKMHNIIIPSFEIRKYCVAKQIRGSMIINQTVKIPPVHLPEKEELHLPQIPERSLHKWLPFGRGDPLKDRKRKLTKRKDEDMHLSKYERSFQVLSSAVDSSEEKNRHSKRKSKKTKDKSKLHSQTEID